MKKLAFLQLLAVASFVACSSDDGVEEAPRLLTVEVTEHALTDEDGTTRTAEPITTESLSAFTLNYQDNHYNLTKSNEGWNNPQWPVPNNDKIDFYANTAGTFQYNSGSPYVSFTMEESAFNQKDLLVAKHEQIAYSDANGKVSLSFDHACAAVKFFICKTKTVEANSITVNSVVLRNVKKKGDYYYSSGWQVDNNETPNFFTLTNGDITLSTDYQQLPCGYLFVIPQSKKGMELVLTYTVGNTQKSKKLDLDGQWDAGIEYTINIRVGSSFIEQ